MGWIGLITATYYSRSPSLHLEGNWLMEAGFDTGVGVIVKVSEGVSDYYY
ncbi:SymE family type I addiction module toxin [Pluralibacter gergoviae]|uniref:SymE family type I addiction module toxin n=1 Tax=Pluralibacter gergoviae TaxID=61647 RepID=A0AAI9DRL8_PLUGE|nr:SymE family type I addiction module toxin [Pluralibacter gergoviae]EKV0930989.1 SymE family type I addiction module toxin [Pluralibacter gergoviae]EKV6250140.1 SymE family type I addiction module toxin [Pluralibacter gergoviae]EKV9911404.1 SymE family type I addiction module toxin [Pluralibacter gergoviae]EKW7277423.1 SymE family type I addiction module toxin [Pluralibacter gergoviae]